MITRLKQRSKALSRKNDFIQALSAVFADKMGDELQIAQVNSGSMTAVTTTKDEKKSDPSFSRMSNFNLMSASTFLSLIPEANQTEKNQIVYKNNERNLKINKSPIDLKFEDFKLIKKIGVGSVSSVFHASYNETSANVALKVTDKSLIVKNRLLQNTGFEKEILSKIDFPFISPLITAFHTQDQFCLVLPFYSGGDLFGRLESEGNLPEDRSCFNSEPDSFVPRSAWL